jgi:G-protein alpha subunit
VWLVPVPPQLCAVCVSVVAFGSVVATGRLLGTKTMGCGASSEAAGASSSQQPPYNSNGQSHNNNNNSHHHSTKQNATTATAAKNPYATTTPNSKSSKSNSDDPQESYKNAGIDRDLDRARQQEELKVKLLLLGAGESGKSTVFKQMRILHGLPRSEDDQRMYGVVVRSNVITAMRKLCTLLRTLNLEEQLAAEPKAERDNGTNMTPKQAYDLIVAHLIDGTGQPEDLKDLIVAPSSGAAAEKDWVGSSARAGLGANTDAQQFLQVWRLIKTLWEVSCCCRCCCCRLLIE